MLRKILRKSQPNFKHHVKKIEAQVKKCFFYKKKKRVEVYLLLTFLLTQSIKFYTFHCHISSRLYEAIFQKCFQSYIKLIVMVADTIKKI